MKELFYRQCFLRKNVESGSLTQVSWIPEPFCKVGKVLMLKEGEIWEDGWMVISAGKPEIGKLIESRSRDYLKTRKNSDI